MSKEGFDIEVELDNDDDISNRDDKVRIFISHVEENSNASKKNMKPGDEIVIINGNLVENSVIDTIQEYLNSNKNLRLTLKSPRLRNEIELQGKPVTTKPVGVKNADQVAITEALISELICPPPPSCSTYKLNNDAIDSLIVPAPEKIENIEIPKKEDPVYSELRLKRQNGKACLGNNGPSDDTIKSLLQECERINLICRMETDFVEQPLDVEQLSRVKPLTNAQKLRKIIFELIETEKNYVKDLSCMIERYLDPLKQESFLTHDDIDSLFGNIQEILVFQKIFLKSLEQSVEEDILTYNNTSQFRSTLFSIGGSFLYYGNHFKVYSSFCASHSKAQKLLKPENNPKLEQFLLARNPKQQHSSSLESYLIKPIQRILKYPLLLKQLINFVDSDTEEYNHLSDALKCMQTVAEQINEMQKIFEEYGSFFETVMKKCKNDRFMRLDLNPNHLLLYGQVEWLNMNDEIEKFNKKHTYETLCFIFNSGALLLTIDHKNKSIKKKEFKQQQNKNACFLTFIPVMELQVRSKHDSQNSKAFLWELIHMHTSVGGSPNKIYTLANRYEDTRQMFVKRIQTLIRESIRQIPIKRPLTEPSATSSSSSTTSSNSTSSSATLSSRSNRPTSYTLNRNSCLNEGGANKIEELTNKIPSSPVWKPRLISQSSIDSEGKLSLTSSRPNSAKRHIQFKLPKNTYGNNELGHHLNIEPYLVMTSNNESTDC